MSVKPFVNDGDLKNKKRDKNLWPDDTSDAWKRNIRDAYMGLKHADRDLPDSLDLINALKNSILVIRFWIAQQLGVRRSILEERRKHNPLAKPFIGID